MTRGTERRRLDGEQIQIRLPAAATAALAAAVATSGETRASWVRGRVLAALGVEASDVVLHRTSASPAASEEMLAIAGFRRDVADLTLALREASAAVGQGKRGASQQLALLARRASGIVGDLGRWKAAVLAGGRMP